MFISQCEQNLVRCTFKLSECNVITSAREHLFKLKYCKMLLIHLLLLTILPETSHTYTAVDLYRIYSVHTFILYIQFILYILNGQLRDFFCNGTLALILVWFCLPYLLTLVPNPQTEQMQDCTTQKTSSNTHPAPGVSAPTPCP